jgi:hypothetical protein
MALSGNHDVALHNAGVAVAQVQQPIHVLLGYIIQGLDGGLAM